MTVYSQVSPHGATVQEFVENSDESMLALSTIAVAHVRVVRFYHSSPSAFSSSFSFSSSSPAPDLSGHCRTSTASARSQWALPDLNCECQISVGTAGPQLHRSGHCRTSTASARWQWALPDLNRELQIAVGTAGQPRAPDRSGHCRTSTARPRSQWALPDLNREQISVGTAGPQH
eukprot:s569_g11.t1